MRDELREAERRIAEHPGYKEHVALEALNLSITAVFVPNWEELLGLLEEASSNELLGAHLAGNVHVAVRNRFDSVLIRRLHNYVASALSLVAHVRDLMSDRSGSIKEEFEKRKQEFLNNPEVPFIKGLRNYTLHRRLPFLGHTFTVSNLNTSEQTFESEVKISTGELLEWTRWTAPARLSNGSRGSSEPPAGNQEAWPAFAWAEQLAP